MGEEISLNDFEIWVRARLQLWASNWRANHDSSPEMWPIEMSLGDWIEHFAVHAQPIGPHKEGINE